MIDPFGGSYAVEALTDEIERKSMEYIEKIDAMGGAIKAIESGYIQGEIAESAYQYQKEIETKKRIIVGLNQFQIEEEPLRDILRIKPEVEQYQKEKLARVKKERNNAKVKETLAVLKKAAQGTDNVVPPILEAVKAYATLGEISDTLREVFGEYRKDKSNYKLQASQIPNNQFRSNSKRLDLEILIGSAIWNLGGGMYGPEDSSAHCKTGIGWSRQGCKGDCPSPERCGDGSDLYRNTADA